MPENRVALVTGASSGIGEAIARRLGAAGFRVFGASRKPPAKYERKAPGPDVVAGKVAAIADNAHPALRNKVTKEAAQFTLLRRVLPPGAYENGVRRAFKVEATDEAQPQRECRVISSVVVSYRVRPEAVAEHVRLIEAVFEQLRAEQPGNVEYKVVRLEDGVSFVHVSSADTADGSNPLPELAAFKEFGRDSAARVATAPVPTAADIIGSYYPAAPLTDQPR